MDSKTRRLHTPTPTPTYLLRLVRSLARRGRIDPGLGRGRRRLFGRRGQLLARRLLQAKRGAAL